MNTHTYVKMYVRLPLLRPHVTIKLWKLENELDYLINRFIRDPSTTYAISI